jgi:Domain of unknown function (DUF4386)
MHTRIWPSIGAGSGLLYVLVFFGASLFGTDAFEYVQLGGMLLLLPFLGYLWSVLHQAEGPGGWLATTALAAGLVDFTIKLGSVAPGHAAQQEPDGSRLHLALDHINSTSFIVTMLPMGVMLSAVAVVILRTRVLPAWLGWSAAGIAPLLLVNGLFLDAEFGPAFLLFLLWLAIASGVLLRRAVRREALAATAATAVAAH